MLLHLQIALTSLLVATSRLTCANAVIEDNGQGTVTRGGQPDEGTADPDRRIAAIVTIEVIIFLNLLTLSACVWIFCFWRHKSSKSVLDEETLTTSPILTRLSPGSPSLSLKSSISRLKLNQASSSSVAKTIKLGPTKAPMTHKLP